MYIEDMGTERIDRHITTCAKSSGTTGCLPIPGNQKESSVVRVREAECPDSGQQKASACVYSSIRRA